MPYTLHFGHPDAEPHTDMDYETLREQLSNEVRQSIEDAGSDGYDPGNMLRVMGVVNYDADKDPEGALWQAAQTAEIERLTWRWVYDHIDAMIYEAEHDVDDLDGGTFYLPNTRIRVWITEEDES